MVVSQKKANGSYTDAEGSKELSTEIKGRESQITQRALTRKGC
jgi:hypothetical protein